MSRQPPSRDKVKDGAEKGPAPGPGLPPLSANDCGEFPIRIARDGTWFYQDSPIGRKALARLLSTVLRRDDSGRYLLVTPAERGIIQVDDAPFTAVEVASEGEGRDRTLRFRTNFDDWVAAGADHPIRVNQDSQTGEPSPYIRVRDNLDALIVRPVFYELVEIAEPVERDGATVLGLWSAGIFFELGSAT